MLLKMGREEKLWKPPWSVLFFKQEFKTAIPVNMMGLFTKQWIIQWYICLSIMLIEYGMNVSVRMSRSFVTSGKLWTILFWFCDKKTKKNKTPRIKINRYEQSKIGVISLFDAKLTIPNLLYAKAFLREEQ